MNLLGGGPEPDATTINEAAVFSSIGNGGSFGGTFLAKNATIDAGELDEYLSNCGD